MLIGKYSFFMPQVPSIAVHFSTTLTLNHEATIQGELEIQIKLTNKGLVHGNNSAGKLHLTTYEKSGDTTDTTTAEFKVSAGLLEVDVAVTGDADWIADGPGFLLVDGGDIDAATCSY